MFAEMQKTLRGWYETAAQKLSSWGMSDFWISLGAYALGGFLTALILKYYGKILILTLVLTVAVLYGFEYFGIIKINYALLGKMEGIQTPLTLSDLWTISSTWIKEHIPQTVAAAVGVFLAWEFA